MSQTFRDLEDGAINQPNDIPEKLREIGLKGYSVTSDLLSIAEAVRLGYGFKRGVCTGLKVAPQEMDRYRAALGSIGRLVDKNSKRAELKHVFAPNAKPSDIENHLNLSNDLMYTAEAYLVKAKFFYAPLELVTNRQLENSIDEDPESIRQRGRARLKTLGFKLDASEDNLERNNALIKYMGGFADQVFQGNMVKRIQYFYDKLPNESTHERIQKAILLAFFPAPKEATKGETAERFISKGKINSEVGLDQKEREMINESVNSLISGSKQAFMAAISPFSNKLEPGLMAILMVENPPNFSDFLIIAALSELIDKQDIAQKTGLLTFLKLSNVITGTLFDYCENKRKPALTAEDCEIIMAIIRESSCLYAQVLLSCSSDVIKQINKFYKAGLNLVGYSKAIARLKNGLKISDEAIAAIIRITDKDYESYDDKEKHIVELLDLPLNKLQEILRG